MGRSSTGSVLRFAYAGDAHRQTGILRAFKLTAAIDLNRGARNFAPMVRMSLPSNFRNAPMTRAVMDEMGATIRAKAAAGLSILNSGGIHIALQVESAKTNREFYVKYCRLLTIYGCVSDKIGQQAKFRADEFSDTPKIGRVHAR